MNEIKDDKKRWEFKYNEKLIYNYTSTIVMAAINYDDMGR